VLYALRDPVSFLLLALSFLLAGRGRRAGCDRIRGDTSTRSEPSPR
jgi:hypothetical protein